MNIRQELINLALCGSGGGGGGDITVKELRVDTNGTYKEDDVAYSPVIVDVKGENKLSMYLTPDNSVAIFTLTQKVSQPDGKVYISYYGKGNYDVYIDGILCGQLKNLWFNNGVIAVTPKSYNASTIRVEMGPNPKSNDFLQIIGLNVMSIFSTDTISYETAIAGFSPSEHMDKLKTIVNKPTAEITITENGEVNVADYGKAIVNVSGGGGSGAKVIEGEFTPTMDDFIKGYIEIEIPEQEEPINSICVSTTRAKGQAWSSSPELISSIVCVDYTYGIQHLQFEEPPAALGVCEGRFQGTRMRDVIENANYYKEENIKALPNSWAEVIMPFTNRVIFKCPIGSNYSFVVGITHKYRIVVC